MRGLRRLRDSGDDGSALAIALTFLMVFGLIIGVVLQFATTGQRTTIAVREEATNTYAGGGALDGAINAIRTNLSQGTAAAGANTCFTLPSGGLLNPTAVTVRCSPRTSSGTALGGGTASQPAQAVLTRGTGTDGLTLGAGASVPIQGDVSVRGVLNAPLTSSLTSTGAVTAGTCVVSGTVSPTCATGAAPVDPGWTGPDTSSTPLATSLPPCSALVRLSPGVYRSAAALQDVLSCSGAVIWFQPGTYFFDFRNAGTHNVTIGTGGVVVGGTPSGWTPGNSRPPVPTASSPTTSACDLTAQGVDLVFGGDSRLAITGGEVQLCALSTSTSAQHIVLRSAPAGLSVTTTSTSTASSATQVAVTGARSWTTPGNGATVDGLAAYVKMPNSGDPSSRLLVGPMSSLPSDATGPVSVTVTVTETLNGTGNTSLLARFADGTTQTRPLRDCTAATPCSASGLVAGRTDTAATFTGLSTAQASGMSVELVVSNPNNSPIEVWVDGVTAAASYSLPVSPPSGAVIGAPYVVGSATTAPLLAASGSGTLLALHGTVYAPNAVLDLVMADSPTTVVDRGMVVRHLRTSMTPAAGFTGPLISVPALGQRPRQVLMTAVDAGGTALVSADMTFANAAGTRNGNIPTVLEWSVG